MSTGRSGQTRGSSSAAPSSAAPRPPQPRCPAPVGLEDPGCPRPRGRSRACRPSEAVSGAHPRLRLRTAPDGTGGSWPWLHGWHVACGAWRNRFRPCSSGTRPPAICLASSWANEKTRPLCVALRGQLGGLDASPTEGAAAVWRPQGRRGLVSWLARRQGRPRRPRERPLLFQADKFGT